ncbi:MAG: hypothetical protein AB7Q00_03250 [Phycisphaerales bacterium]|nr:MAG: hypothetical protein IPK69_07885 [Phycisphaerales bacterium]
MKTRNPELALLVMVVSSVWLLFLPACTDTGRVLELRDQAAHVREQLAQEGTQIRGVLAQLPIDDPARPGLDAQLKSVDDAAQTLSAAIEQVDRALGNANNPTETEGMVGTLTGTISSVLPTPWRVPVALGAALVAAVLRARQLKAGLASIAKSLEVAMRDDEQLKTSVKANAQTLRTIQTPVAQQIVDQVQAGSVALKFPW